MAHRLEQILNDYNVDAPLQDARTIPASWYVNPDVAALERNAVFGATWQCVGRSAQVERPGMFLTAEVAGEPVVVVRGDDGVLRAFFNVCRHHAAAVMTEAQGSCSVMQCPYHGWTYALDGRLKSSSETAALQSFEPCDHGLLPIRVETWESFVFVNLAAAGGSLRDWLGEMAGRVAPLELEKLTFVERRIYQLECNWKVYVDNYLDGGYHVPYLHKRLNSVLNFREYTVENGTHWCLQSSPMRASDDVSGNVRGGEKAYYFWLYPNFMINWYRGVMDTNLVLPVGIDETVVIFDYFFEDTSAAAAATRAESMKVSEQIQDEDVAICESVQRGLGSRSYQAGRLVQREAGEHLFHRLLAGQLRSAR